MTTEKRTEHLLFVNRAKQDTEESRHRSTGLSKLIAVFNNLLEPSNYTHQISRSLTINISVNALHFSQKWSSNI